MRTLADIESALQRLADDRPVFHSEDDFQYALAWRLHRDFDDMVVRLEYPLPWGGRRAYADIWLAPAGRPARGRRRHRVEVLEAEPARHDRP